MAHELGHLVLEGRLDPEVFDSENVTEPGQAFPKEQPRRFQRLVFRALAEDLIGESKAAELLGISQIDPTKKRNLDFSNGADFQ